MKLKFDGAKSVSFYEEHGGLKLEIFLDAGRKLTENDNRNIRRYADKIIESVQTETNLIDPDRQKVKMQMEKEILSLFTRPIFVEKIPNGYCSGHCCVDTPWFIVTTKVGRIKIGWRKSVINIDYSDTIVKEKAEVLFSKEDTTRHGKVIHAWSVGDAKRYLNKIIG